MKIVATLVAVAHKSGFNGLGFWWILSRRVVALLVKDGVAHCVLEVIELGESIILA